MQIFISDPDELVILYQTCFVLTILLIICLIVLHID